MKSVFLVRWGEPTRGKFDPSWPPTDSQWQELFGKEEEPPPLTFRDEDQPFGWPEIDA